MYNQIFKATGFAIYTINFNTSCGFLSDLMKIMVSQVDIKVPTNATIMRKLLPARLQLKVGYYNHFVFLFEPCMSGYMELF